MMIASMIAVELIRICFSAAATGPTGSRIPRLQELKRKPRAKAGMVRRAVDQGLHQSSFMTPRVTADRLPERERLWLPYFYVTAKSMIFGDPNGTRTRVFAVKGRRPRPLDDGAARSGCRLGEPPIRVKQARRLRGASLPHCRRSTRRA